MWGVLLTATALTGCATTPIPPTYTQEELKAICQRHGACGTDDLTGGFCEYQSDGFLYELVSARGGPVPLGVGRSPVGDRAHLSGSSALAYTSARTR